MNGTLLTMRSKITVRWTTNPADLGYDGVKSNWKEASGETMGMSRAANFSHELSNRVGQGVYRAISYKCGDEDVSIDEIRDIVMMSQAASALGRKGGLVKSERKAKSSAENGKKGGRPRKVVDNLEKAGQV